MSEETFEGRPEQHLRLEDLPDIELLHALYEASDETGRATSGDIAEHLQIHARYPKRMVGARMSWLVRMGLVDRDDDGFWSLSAEGRQIYKGRNLNSRQTEQLAKLLAGNLAGAASLLTSHIGGSGDVQFNTVRRQMRYAELRRKRGLR